MTLTSRSAGTTPQIAHKGLKTGALGLTSAIVIAVASTAPAYALTSALGSVAGAVGLRAPVAILAAFVPMLLISFAYKALNNVDPDCGTSFTWVARAFGRRTGWLTGWVIILADVVVMANLAYIAGTYTFMLFGLDSLAASTLWSTVVGGLWILAMTLISWIGIEISARSQMMMLALEVLILLVMSAVALVKVYTGHAGPLAIHPSASWFNPFASGMSLSAFTAGLIAAVFIYWGWDSAVAVNEETADATVTPGKAAVTATLLLLVIFTVVTVAVQAYAGVGSTGIGLTSPSASVDALSGIGQAALGTWGFKLLILAILSSSAASAQTTILPTARTTLSMAVHKALPAGLAAVHRRFQTPTVATWTMGLVSIAFYITMTYLKHGSLLTDLIAAVGLQIAFYYGLTGLACAWYFRHVARSAKDCLTKVALPLLGGLILLGAGLYSAHNFWNPANDLGGVTLFGVGGTFVLGVGAMALGIPLMLIWNATRDGRAYFSGRTMADARDVVQTG
jgi:amino acid transporter